MIISGPGGKIYESDPIDIVVSHNRLFAHYIRCADETNWHETCDTNCYEANSRPCEKQ